MRRLYHSNNQTTPRVIADLATPRPRAGDRDPRETPCAPHEPLRVLGARLGRAAGGPLVRASAERPRESRASGGAAQPRFRPCGWRLLRGGEDPFRWVRSREGRRSRCDADPFDNNEGNRRGVATCRADGIAPTECLRAKGRGGTSHRQALATLLPTTVDDRATVPSAHPHQEAVGPLASTVVGLKRPLHVEPRLS